MATTAQLFDKEFALTQLGGNTDLLKRMLVKFEQEFKTVPEEVKTLFNNNEIKEAKLKVHTTKGLSGNLGLMALYESAKLLDQQLRAGVADDSMIALFAQTMADTCNTIEHVNLAQNSVPEFTNNVSSNNYYEEFIQRLERHEFIDDESLHKYVNDLNLSDDEKKHLVSLVEELQYAKAIDIIKKLA